MKPIPFFLQRDTLLVPRLVEDAFGQERLVAPDDADVPKTIVIELLGFPSDAAIVSILYPSPSRAEEKVFPLPLGWIALDRETGYLKKVRVEAPTPDQSHYDIVARLLGAYRAYVRNLPVTDAWRWHAMFVAGIVSGFWSEEELKLRMLIHLPPIP